MAFGLSIHITIQCILATAAITVGGSTLCKDATGSYLSLMSSASNNTKSKTASSCGQPSATASRLPRDTYVPHYGDGSSAEGWPTKSAWVSFDDMWMVNAPNMEVSCAQWGVADNSGQELRSMRAHILQLSKVAALDPQFILAVILQESAGCVRVITTAYSHHNPGLMQSFNGSGTCNTNNAPLGLPGVDYTGVINHPCPDSEIYQMILDGTRGTEWGHGLEGLYKIQGRTDVSGVYRTARLYNGGSLSVDGNLTGPCCTPSYASDIANRLTGWVYAPNTFSP